MNYFVTNASLMVLEEAGVIDWQGYGFDPRQVSRAVSNGCQQMDNGKLVSMLPIADEELLRTKLADYLECGEDSFGYYRILPEAEAMALRDSLKAVNDAEAARLANIPSDEDTYRAQQLLLLTEISNKLGGASNV